MDLYGGCHIQNGPKQDALLPLISNFVLVYGNEKVQEKEDVLELSEAHRILRR
jgi:hypothetical protein